MPASSTITVVPAGEPVPVERVAGRGGATRGAAWRPCRRPCRSRVPGPGPPWPSGPPRTPAVRCAARSSTARSQHRRLARAGRSDDHHQPVGAGDRGGGVGLQHVQPVTVDGGRRARVVGLGVDRPGEDAFLLGEDRVAGEVRGGRFEPHRPAIRHRAGGPPVGRVEIDAALDDLVGGPFQRGRPPLSRHRGHGGLQVADRPAARRPGSTSTPTPTGGRPPAPPCTARR